MNVLFMTQSGSLELFYDVARALTKTGRIEKVGFYVSDSQFYNHFKKTHPELSDGSCELLKEWDIIRKSKDIEVNIERLRRYEKIYGDPYLWNALVADRRIYLGETATLQQDYASRFDHDRMMAILQVAIEEMEALFDRVRPNLVVGFICVTIGDYLSYLIAKSRNMKFCNLRPTRIKNFFYGAESVLEPSANLEAACNRMLNSGMPLELGNEVRSYLQEVRLAHAMYEGVVPPDGKSYGTADTGSELNRGGKIFLKKIRKIVSLTKQMYSYKFGEYKYDNSHRGVLFPLWFKKIKQPLRIRLTDASLRKHYISPRDLSKLDYVFYPLHKEPEVTLLVYSRPYLNQLEVVRTLARSLPVGMKLVVKEHPACLGYRRLKYYHKLLDIPNVGLLPPQTKSRDIIQHAKLVTVISGSIGLEALMLEKPVIHFGNVPFSILPDSMIRRVRDLDHTADDIQKLLSEHDHNEKALESYIAAVMKCSVAVDFYSVLLKRRGVFRPDAYKSSHFPRADHIEHLAAYIGRYLTAAA